MSQPQEIDLLWVHEEKYPEQAPFIIGDCASLYVNRRRVGATVQQFEAIPSPVRDDRIDYRLTINILKINIGPGTLFETNEQGIQIDLCHIAERIYRQDLLITITLRLYVVEQHLHQFSNIRDLKIKAFFCENDYLNYPWREAEASRRCHYYHGQSHGNGESKQFIRCFNHPGATTCDGCPDFKGHKGSDQQQHPPS